MTHPIRNRSRLLLGCGGAALALALVVSPQAAAAQGIQATGNVVSGTASINTINTTTTQVDVLSPTAVIDWTPQEDAGGNALDFLRAGATGIFETSQLQNFAVLNRILPSTNGNIAVIDGAVISRIVNPSAGTSVPGGFVAFYSPTGILIGSNATFDVGSLLLTTLDTTPASFDSFVNGGNLSLAGAPGSTARISIAAGAQITATLENSFFAMVAADVEMRGTALINGSHAYVAGEVVNLSFSNGLFNISVPVGTAAAGEVLTVNGTVGGPSSNGAGDNHLIYGVARAANDPISMLFRGNLGFAPAASAGIVNGEIILSANHDVFGRFVDGGTISDGINATFGGNSALTTVRGDIFIEDFTASSSLLAIGSHRVRAAAANVASSVAGNLMLVGRENAELIASNGRALTITGDLLVDARDYGVFLSSSSGQTLDVLNAQGGAALVDVSQGGAITVNGSALITADAFAGVDSFTQVVGTARGGSARINANGGNVTIGVSGTLSARGIANAGQTGGPAIGGQAELSVAGASVITSDLIEMISNAETTSGGSASAGTSSLVVAGGSTATVNATQINLLADAFGANFGSFANSAGRYIVSVGGGNVNAGSLFASAFGDTVPANALPSQLVASSGNLNVAGDLAAFALGNIQVRTAGGGIIGGPRSAATTTNVLIVSDATIEIAGDNNAAVGLGGDTINLAASDIDILSGARIGANVVSIRSLNENATAILGGTTDGSGFTLTADEIARISTRELEFGLPRLFGSNDPNQPDLLIRDLALVGSDNGGVALARIFVGGEGPEGIIEVQGTISYTNAGVNDLLQLDASRINIITPGGIRIEGAANVPGGNLRLSADDIWVADAALITQLLADPNFAGRDALLAVAAPGSADPRGYVRAGRVSLDVRRSLLVRNTGDAFAGGGILVGSGGLTIENAGQFSSGLPLDVYAYGRRQVSATTFVVGDAFFNEVNFNRVSPGTNIFLDASAFNDCIINTGACPDRPPPPTLVPPQINNPTLFEPPLTIGGNPPAVRGQDDERFGIDFPERPEAPLITEDPLLDDPVTSGSDASLYGSSDTPPAGGK